MVDNYFAYIMVAVAVTSIPGPAVILNIKNSLQYGVTASLYSVFGNFFAMLLLATLSALGLGTILLASSTLFLIVKVLGACYLIYMGFGFFKTVSKHKITLEKTSNSNKSYFTIFKEGFIVGLSNPKAIIFFAALFPQFINPENSYFMQFLVLILTIEGISTLILIGYVLLASKVSVYLLKETILKYLNKTIGSLFVLFGVFLLTSK